MSDEQPAGAWPAEQQRRRLRFEAIYAANRGPILGYALRRTSNGDDAADVVADTFLTAWRRLDDIPAGEQARLWLYGVARRVLANHRRGEQRKSELAGRLRADLATARHVLTGQRELEQAGQFAAAAQAFKSLRAEDRELLSLVAWEGLDHAQIAAVLGCSAGAVRIRLHRARARLAAALARQPEPPQRTFAPVTPGEAR